MEIYQKELKTVYHISLSLLDFCNAFEIYKISPLKDIGEYKNAFRNCASEDDVMKLMKGFHTIASTATLDFMVKEYLGFSDIENYGYYDARNDCYAMVVYKRGNKMEDK